jgi:hypothetical protein
VKLRRRRRNAPVVVDRLVAVPVGRAAVVAVVAVVAVAVVRVAVAVVVDRAAPADPVAAGNVVANVDAAGAMVAAVVVTIVGAAVKAASSLRT